jgi:hypothetical protein
MKREFRLMVAAIATTLPLWTAGAAQTINFGPNLPQGPVPDGYAGFNWHGADNADLFDFTPTHFGSADISEMSRTSAFDLDNIVLAPLNLILPSYGNSILATTISGYLNGTLVETLTAHYSPIQTVTSRILNMDGVNEVTFTTIDTRKEYDSVGYPTIISSEPTMVTQMTVDNFTGVARAPELDPTTTASALTLLLGSLFVIRGRRPARRSYKY